MNLSFSTIHLVHFKRPRNYTDEEHNPQFSTHVDVYQTSQEMCSGEHTERELGAGALNTVWRRLDKFPGFFSAKMEPQTNGKQSKVHLSNVNTEYNCLSSQKWKRRENPGGC